jgi:hypothetical protein
LDSVGPNHIVTQIRGLKIKMQQNGIPLVDTERNIGMGQANTMKPNIYPPMLSGFMYFDANGTVQKTAGDLPFIDRWNTIFKQQMGVFYIRLPAHPVGLHESWTVTMPLNANGAVAVAEPLFTTNTFTRDLDSANDGNPVACFNITAADHLQNVAGYYEQMGQKTSMNMPEFNHSTFGSFQFDRKRNVIVSSKITDTADATTEMVVQGNTASSHITLQNESTVTLIPAP